MSSYQDQLVKGSLINFHSSNDDTAADITEWDLEFCKVGVSGGHLAAQQRSQIV